MGTRILTIVAFAGVVVVSIIVFDLGNPFSLLGAVVKSLPYVGVWAICKNRSHPKRLPLYLAGGLAAYLVMDAYVSFYAVRRPQSSTDPIAAFTVEVASVVIIPMGALVTIVLVRISERAYELLRH